jgi:hypothetical protein
MDVVDVAPGRVEEPAPAAAPADGSASLANLVRDTGEYARTLGVLVAREAELARINLTRLLVVGLLVPAIAGSAVLALEALVVTVLARWFGSWIIATGLIAAANLALLATALWMLRDWWRSLSLPRSRAAVASLWTRPS